MRVRNNRQAHLVSPRHATIFALGQGRNSLKGILYNNGKRI
jgi:hypothetical protein